MNSEKVNFLHNSQELEQLSHECSLGGHKIIVEINRHKKRDQEVENLIQDTLSKCDNVRQIIKNSINSLGHDHLTVNCLKEIARILIQIKTAENIADQYDKSQDKNFEWESKLNTLVSSDIYGKVILPILNGNDPFE